MKTLIEVHHNPATHWVGNGFPVRTLFFYQDLGRAMNPFLMLDHAGPHTFAPTAQRLGVGSHPHRGFETVTLVYAGEVSHKDSTGAGGTIGPGDVQWMTAGAGVLHEEWHSEAFAKKGGVLDMVQLWVNLPAQHKMTAPKYQAILSEHIPSIALLNGAGVARVIAGHYQGQQGPASTFTPMQVVDVNLQAGATVTLEAPLGWNTGLAVLKGAVGVAGTTATQASLMMFSREGQGIELTAQENSVLLLLSGQPIEEPIVGHGPFVMNTEEEIAQAVRDFGLGRQGILL